MVQDFQNAKRGIVHVSSGSGNNVGRQSPGIHHKRHTSRNLDQFVNADHWLVDASFGEPPSAG